MCRIHATHRGGGCVGKTMERRNLLKAVGSIGTAATVGGAGFFAMTGGATATANANYGDVTVTSDDGTVEYVAIYGSSTVTWDGFDSTAMEARIVNEAQIPGQVGWLQLNNTGRFALDNDSWGGADENLSGIGTSGTIETGIGLRSNGNHDPTTDWHVVGSDPDGYGLPQNSIDPANLEVDADGDTGSFDVELRATYYWYDANGNKIFQKSFTSTVDVTVNNEPQTASGSSSNSGAVAE